MAHRPTIIGAETAPHAASGWRAATPAGRAATTLAGMPEPAFTRYSSNETEWRHGPQQQVDERRKLQ